MSEIKLQDYIQYYIGCKCIRFDGKSTGYQYDLMGYEIDPLSRSPYYIKSDSNYYWVTNIRPILRKLEDITNEEFKDYLNWDRLNEIYVDVSFEKVEHAYILNYSIPLEFGTYPQAQTLNFIELRPDQFHWLCKHGFDLFGLIDTGLAIDSKALTT